MSDKAYIHLSPFRKQFYRSARVKPNVHFSTTVHFKSRSGEVDFQEFDNTRQELRDSGYSEVVDPDKISVKLTYFKPSGKYYADGVFLIDPPGDDDPNGAKSWYDTLNLIEKLQLEGKLPGLVSGSNEFTVHVSGEGHPGGYPTLFHPKG